MSKRIFISYRRDDSGGYAIALHAELEKYFGKENVFFDVGGSIRPGENFDSKIKKAVKSSDVLLALIGKSWLSISDGDGRRRLDNPKDYVNIEIATALKNKILIIPILIKDTKMPTETALPSNLRTICKCQAIEIRHSHFKPDAETLLLNLGIVMNKIGQTVSRGEDELTVLEVKNISCQNCGTTRDPDLQNPCPLCGSRNYFFVGYTYPNEIRNAIVILLILIVVALVAGVLYLIINTFKILH